MTQDTNALDQARAQLDSILDMVERYNTPTGNDEVFDEIQADPLEITVRSNWEGVGKSMRPAEYRILLCTGGPAVMLTGELDDFLQPASVRLEYQDWFLPWARYPLTQEQSNACMTYANCFYYGE